MDFIKVRHFSSYKATSKRWDEFLKTVQMNADKPRELSEDAIQNQCYIWFNNNYCLKSHENRCMIFAVPNGGSRNIVEAIKLKNTGVLSGVSDLIVVLPCHILFIEMKAAKGVLSGTQMEFRERIRKLGFNYHVCYSLQEFKDLIKISMNNNDLF